MTTRAGAGGFFRTMVLMGGSVAVSCGGMTGTDTGSGGGSSVGGSGGSDTETGGTPGAGSATASTGGATAGSGGTIIVGPSTGGASGSGGSGGFGGAYPMDCPTTQLSCAPQNLYTSCSTVDYGFLVLPPYCECDPERPQAADDCATDEHFVCQGASENANGERLDPVVPYNCECISGALYDSCWDICDHHSASTGSVICEDPGESTPDLEAYLCGCAVTILK